MEAKLPEITISETICEKIKNIYFEQLNWIDCYKLVANQFTKLKINAKKFYNEKTELEMLKEVNKYSIFDIKELLEGDNSHGREENPVKPL